MARFVWDRSRDAFVPAAEFYAARRPEAASDHPRPYVIGDIEPYRSVATGEFITSRSHHRDMLRAHGLQEVGNERLAPRPAYEPSGIAQDIKKSIEQLQSGTAEPVPTLLPGVDTRIYGS